MKKLLPLVALLALFCSAVLLAQTPKKLKPQITISSVPSDSPGEMMASKPISGTVKNAPKGAVVVVFAFGDTWYVQPWANSPFTAVKNGKWSTETHGGYEFVAYLVKPSYQPPATTWELPKVGGNILAMARYKPKN